MVASDTYSDKYQKDYTCYNLFTTHQGESKWTKQNLLLWKSEEDKKDKNILMNKSDSVAFIQKHLTCNLYSSSVSIETEIFVIAASLFTFVFEVRNIALFSFQRTIDSKITFWKLMKIYKTERCHL